MALVRFFSPLVPERFPMLPSADSLIEHFSQVPDPRIERSQRHRLIDIVVIAVCGAICGADNWVHIAEFGRSKYDWLKTFLALPNGIPSHDTFGRVFARISPEHFQACFSAWVQSLLPKLDEEIVPIDGKTLRHSYDRTSGKAAVHMVNAWAVKNRLVLGQFHCESGLDEITIIPQLLRVLALRGCIVTVDAIGCHKSVAEQIIDQQGDYVLAVKANQPKLLNHVRQVFDRAEPQLHQVYPWTRLRPTMKTTAALRPAGTGPPIRSTILPMGRPGRAWACSVWSKPSDR